MIHLFCIRLTNTAIAYKWLRNKIRLPQEIFNWTIMGHTQLSKYWKADDFDSIFDSGVYLFVQHHPENLITYMLEVRKRIDIRPRKLLHPAHHSTSDVFIHIIILYLFNKRRRNTLIPPISRHIPRKKPPERLPASANIRQWVFGCVAMEKSRIYTPNQQYFAIHLFIYA